MTNKEKTIEAFEKLIHKYQHPFGQGFGHFENCPLCYIHRLSPGDCKGCPLADPEGRIGCTEFNSYPENCDFNFEKESSPEFKRRAIFFIKYLPIIKEIPAKQFTKKGWKYFNFDLND